MSHLFRTTALISLIASPAFADITAQDALDMIKAQNAAMGLKMEVSQSRKGDTVTLDDIKLTGQLPFEWGSVELTSSGISLTENADGTVAMKLPDSLPFAMALSLPDDVYVTAQATSHAENYQNILSGTPGDIQMRYSMDRTHLELTELTATGAETFTLDFSLDITDVAGLSHFKTGNMLTGMQQYSYGGMDMSWTYQFGKVGSTNSFTSGRTSGKNSFALPANGIDFANSAAQLRDGMALELSSEMQDYHTKATIYIADKLQQKQDASVRNTVTDIRISADGFGIMSKAEGYDLAIKLVQLPFDIKASLTDAVANFKLPLLTSEQDQDLVYDVRLNGITLPEDLWALMDPKNVLPHDPADLVVDMSGKGRLFYDLLDFKAMQKVADEGLKFAEVTSARLNQLELSAIGAHLLGSGAFTFDNSDLETLKGFPATEGTASFKLTGINGGIDALQKAGIISPNDVMPMRMGLAAFFAAGDAPDTMVSDVKITLDGKIFTNGKRFK